MHTQFGTLMQFASEDTVAPTLNGSVYRKQLAKYQDWVNPDYPWFSDDPIMTLDAKWGDQIVQNFNKNTLGSPVPVPANHTDDVEANRGVVLSVESIPGDGLYGNLEIKDAKTVEQLDNGTIFDVSISFAWDFVRTDDNKHYGPTLCHVALVNTPYLMGMKGFEKVGMALSRLEESIRPNSLSLAGSNVIMLSRNTMKEFSNMGLATIKNDKEFPVTVTFKDGDEEKTLVIEPATEVEVPAEVAEEVLTQVADAEAPTTDDGATDDPTEGDTATTDAPADEDEDPKAELARIKLENAELKLSRAYDQLLSEGKVTPAQKDKIMGLAKLTQNTELSTPSGTKTDLASVVLDILGTGVQKFSTEESGSNAENPATENKDQTDEDKKPSENLSEDELAGLKAVGATPEQLDAMAAKDPVFAASLASMDRK